MAIASLSKASRIFNADFNLASYDVSSNIRISYDSYEYYSVEELKEKIEEKAKIADISIWRITTDGLSFFLEEDKECCWIDHDKDKRYKSQDKAIRAFEEIILQARIDIMLMNKQLVKTEFNEKTDKDEFESRTIVLSNK